MIVNEADDSALKTAIEFLQKDQVISFATDTIYGLAVDATSDIAVQNLYKIKKRDLAKPIAIFVKDLQMAQEILQFDELSSKIANKFLPGALTIILPKKSQQKYQLSKFLNDNSEFLGFRFVNQKFVNDLLAEFKKPLAVTSANISAQEHAKDAAEVAKYFANDLNLIIKSEQLSNSKPSTVIKIEGKKLSILRQGQITKNQIDEFITNF